jgi:hypothetical protein
MTPDTFGRLENTWGSEHSYNWLVLAKSELPRNGPAWQFWQLLWPSTTVEPGTPSLSPFKRTSDRFQKSLFHENLHFQFVYICMYIYISNLYTYVRVCMCVCVCVWQGIPCQFFKTARSPKTRVFKRKSFSLFSQRSYSDSLHILPFSLKPYCDKTLSTLALFKKQKVSEEIPYVPTLLDLMDRTVW